MSSIGAPRAPRAPRAPHARAPQPLLFTVEFRRKMAQLPIADRREWLASLAERVRTAPSATLREELREVARGCRLELAAAIQKHLGSFAPVQVRAVLEVPRERFVRPGDLERSADDTPLSLDDEGLATISAPHAYLLSYRLLELSPGDTLVELGSGSGYGAALASFIVGPTGWVRSFEIDAGLARWAERSVSEAGLRNVSVQQGDAMTSAPRWEGARKVVVTFAVEAIPDAWVEALPAGGALVAPVGGAGGDQRLVLVRREGDRLVRTEHGAVRYVQNRSR
jgi:protein-L-isoaspartate(D-aspartate) O-methyltransferase